MKNTFQYTILLTSRFQNGYSFRVFNFGYDVSIYPVSLDIESEISEEMGIKKEFLGYPNLSFNDEEALMKTITKIFRTDKFAKTVGGLMKIERSKANQNV